MWLQESKDTPLLTLAAEGEDWGKILCIPFSLSTLLSTHLWTPSTDERRRAWVSNRGLLGLHATPELRQKVSFLTAPY
jgi:hypothetical protein